MADSETSSPDRVLRGRAHPRRRAAARSRPDDERNGGAARRPRGQGRPRHRRRLGHRRGVRPPGGGRRRPSRRRRHRPARRPSAWPSDIGGDARRPSRPTSPRRPPSREMVAAVVEQFGRLDGAVNNAGVGGAHFAVGDYPLDDWRRVMRVNLDGVFLCVREEIRAMREQRRRLDRQHGVGAGGGGLSRAGRLRHVEARARRPDARRRARSCRRRHPRQRAWDRRSS